METHIKEIIRSASEAASTIENDDVYEIFTTLFNMRLLTEDNLHEIAEYYAQQLEQIARMENIDRYDHRLNDYE